MVMTAADWILIALIIVGCVLRSVGRTIRVNASMRFSDNPDKLQQHRRMGTRILWAGMGLAIVSLIVLLVLMAVRG